MRILLKAAAATTALVGALLITSAPARADDFGISINGGVGFSYDSGGYCDSYGCPDDFWDYPVAYCPVYFRGQWYRGPLYYRERDGDYYYWVHGNWRRDEWDDERPSWACEDRFGPPLGIDFYLGHGFHWRNEWRDRFYRNHHDGDRHDWNRNDRGDWNRDGNDRNGHNDRNGGGNDWHGGRHGRGSNPFDNRGGSGSTGGDLSGGHHDRGANGTGGGNGSGGGSSGGSNNPGSGGGSNGWTGGHNNNGGASSNGSGGGSSGGSNGGNGSGGGSSGGSNSSGSDGGGHHGGNGGGGNGGGDRNGGPDRHTDTL